MLRPTPHRIATPLLVAMVVAIGGCDFTGLSGGGGGDGDGDGDGDADAAPEPGPDEVRAAHVPLSSWGKGAGDLVVQAASEIDTSNLQTTNLTLPTGALFDAVVQAGALGLPPDEQPREIALLRVASLHVTLSGTLSVRGSRPLVIVVAGEALIEGGIDARAIGDLPGAGGSESGGLGEGEDGSTPLFTERHGGGGGGGFGTEGARGGSVDCICIEDADGGDGGAVYGDPQQSFLYGGSAGGRPDTCNSSGGAGGGSIQITAETSIVHSGWIAVDGGGGEAGVDCSPPMTTIQAAGGGGGSGGSIYLEAPMVTVSGVLSANGGAGASGFPGSAGADGQMGSASAAAGGQSAGNESEDGGDGGFNTTSPEVGSGWGNRADGNAGGGGGGVGRITIKSPTVTTSGNVSPPAIQI